MSRNVKIALVVGAGLLAWHFRYYIVLFIQNSLPSKAGDKPAVAMPTASSAVGVTDVVTAPPPPAATPAAASSSSAPPAAAPRLTRTPLVFS